MISTCYILSSLVLKPHVEGLHYVQKAASIKLSHEKCAADNLGAVTVTVSDPNGAVCSRAACLWLFYLW